MKTHNRKFINDLKQANILVVDHQKLNISMIKRVLHRDGYGDVQATQDPFSVVSYCDEENIDLIILDIKMPKLDGFGVINSLREELGEEHVPPILIVTDVSDQAFRREALTYGARDYIIRPFDIREFVARVHNLLEVRQAHHIVNFQKEILEEKVQERTRELREAHDQLQESRLDVVWRLGRAAEYRDNETGLHIIRMSQIAAVLGRAYGMTEEEADLLLVASPMHDIGKLGIPDNVLLKPGKLDNEEWKIMQTHAQIGANILAGGNSDLMIMAHEIALTHHEKWDGSGYPYGIQGDEIPLVGRISALADVFDALTSERPYKKAWSVGDAMDLIYSESGKHFEPRLVELLKEKLPKVLEIKAKYAETFD
ncbi:MAG: response regulator [Gammaproteobacteria bacterium]|nr:response regulator [Gammaproteobacteria bacterium]